MKSSVKGLDNKLQKILVQKNFINMEGIAKEVPIFIQTYNPSDEDQLKSVVKSTLKYIKSKGIFIKHIDLFEIVLRLLEKKNYLKVILEEESIWNKMDLLATLNNVADPMTELIPEIIKSIGEETQITLITGSGTIYPFLRTHSIVEALQPSIINHPIIIFFPGEYSQDAQGGSYLSLFGSHTNTKIESPHYRAINLNYFNT